MQVVTVALAVVADSWAAVTVAARGLMWRAAARPHSKLSGLSVTVQTALGERLKPASDVSFAVDDAQILGIVGENGSGKSLSCLAVMSLLHPGGAALPTARSVSSRTRTLVAV